MIAILVIGGLAPFTILKGKDGKPLMSFSDIKAPKMKVPDIGIPDLNNAVKRDEKSSYDEGTVFKWKDKDGVWQFSSKPPKDSQFTSTKYDNNLNVIKPVKTKRSENNTNGLSNEQKKPKPKGVADLGSAYSPENVEKLFDDANNLENVLKGRIDKQNELLNNL